MPTQEEYLKQYERQARNSFLRSILFFLVFIGLLGGFLTFSTSHINDIETEVVELIAANDSIKLINNQLSQSRDSFMFIADSLVEFSTMLEAKSIRTSAYLQEVLELLDEPNQDLSERYIATINLIEILEIGIDSLRQQNKAYPFKTLMIDFKKVIDKTELQATLLKIHGGDIHCCPGPFVKHKTTRIPLYILSFHSSKEAANKRHRFFVSAHSFTRKPLILGYNNALGQNKYLVCITSRTHCEDDIKLATKILETRSKKYNKTNNLKYKIGFGLLYNVKFN